MYGWRKKIGLILPSANTVNEPEFHESVPEGVSVHSARMHHTVATVENQAAMIDKMEGCAELLKTADVDIQVFGCTTGSLVKGAEYAGEVERRLSELSGTPAVSTAASIIRAFEALDIGSLAVATPYPHELDEREVEYLEDSGIEVQDIHGLGIKPAAPKANIASEDVYRQVMSDLDSTDADGVFISCTNYRSFEIIDHLESELGKPVVSSNQATLWDTLVTLNVANETTGPGELFSI